MCLKQRGMDTSVEESEGESVFDKDISDRDKNGIHIMLSSPQTNSIILCRKATLKTHPENPACLLTSQIEM